MIHNKKITFVLSVYITGVDFIKYRYNLYKYDRKKGFHYLEYFSKITNSV